MKKLAAQNRVKTIDLLAERHAFERTGVQLYTALLEAIGAEKDSLLTPATEKLTQIRFDEAEHQVWLEGQLRTLGADPDERTRLVNLSDIESTGIVDVVLVRPRPPAEMLHAILAAELVDHAGWNALIQLASEAHDEQAQEAIRKRLHEENEHLNYIRLLNTALLREEMTGELTDLRRKAA